MDTLNGHTAVAVDDLAAVVGEHAPRRAAPRLSPSWPRAFLPASSACTGGPRDPRLERIADGLRGAPRARSNWSMRALGLSISAVIRVPAALRLPAIKVSAGSSLAKQGPECLELSRARSWCAVHFATIFCFTF